MINKSHNSAILKPNFCKEMKNRYCVFYTINEKEEQCIGCGKIRVRRNYVSKSSRI